MANLKKSIKSKTLALSSTPGLTHEGEYQRIKYGSTEKFKQPPKKLSETKV